MKRRYTRWNKDKVINRLKELEKDNNLYPTYIMYNEPSLYDACRRYFGSYSNALEMIGKSSEDVNLRKSWTKKEIQEELLHLYNTEKVTTTYMSKNHRNLYDLARRHFNTYSNALKSIGLNLEELSKIEFEKSVERSNIWSKDRIKEELTNLYNEGNLYSKYLHENRKDLIGACYEYFGGMRKALKGVGLEYNKVSDYSLITKGMEFEYIIGDIFDELNINYDKSTINGLRPDFRLDNNIWVDAKLSQWTSSIPNTIKKYKDHCDKLIIVFLRGYSEKEITEDGIEIVSIDTYLKELGIDEDHEVFYWIAELREKVK